MLCNIPKVKLQYYVFLFTENGEIIFDYAPVHTGAENLFMIKSRY